MSEHDRSNPAEAREPDRTRGDTDDRSIPESADSRWMTVDDIRAVYADQADMMDRFSIFNRLLTGRYRRALFGRARGRVLDVACGMGANRKYLPEGVEYVGVDISPAMLAKAEANDDRLKRGETLFEMDAEALEFPDDRFDTVISSLSTCTFPDPVATVNEMNRVCKPGGRILLLEHGRSDVGAIARFQDWRAESHYEKHGCRLTQEPEDIVARADPAIRSVSARLAGTITAIVAEPRKRGSE